LIKEIEDEGGQVDYCILGRTRSEASARHLENALIAILPQTFNRTGGFDNASFWKPYPHIPRLAHEK
jgi:hypothetical protein